MNLDLFGPVRARRSRASDPETSHAAAATVNDFAPNHFGIIVHALKSRGPMTVSEIASATGLAEQATNKRLPELQRAKAVDVTGETRPGASGRMQRVWRAL